jgi:hypothetical protein
MGPPFSASLHSLYLLISWPLHVVPSSPKPSWTPALSVPSFLEDPVLDSVTPHPAFGDPADHPRPWAFPKGTWKAVASLEVPLPQWPPPLVCRCLTAGSPGTIAERPPHALAWRLFSASPANSLDACCLFPLFCAVCFHPVIMGGVYSFTKGPALDS